MAARIVNNMSAGAVREDGVGECETACFLLLVRDVDCEKAEDDEDGDADCDTDYAAFVVGVGVAGGVVVIGAGCEPSVGCDRRHGWRKLFGDERQVERQIRFAICSR